MAYSIQREVSDGTLATIDLAIDYIDREDVTLYVDDVLIDKTGGSTPYTWDWVTDTQVLITPVVPLGLVVMVKRNTPMEQMYHNFDAGAVFKNESVDENFLQVLYLTQEAKEGSGATDLYTDLDMHGYVIRNHGPATLDGDLVTYGQYRNDSWGASFNRIAAEAARDVTVAARDVAVSSAGAAALSESNAADSELAAGNSATSANDDRILAENAASTAVAAYDSFDDRYLGPKTSNPTVDNDGNALLEGALYWNTVAKEMRVYDGTAWSVAYLPAVGYMQGSANLSDVQDVQTAKENLDLGNVDDTSDVDKPVSTAQANALASKQDTLVSSSTVEVDPITNTVRITDIWALTPIGAPFPIWDHIAGVEVPPTDNPDYRYIKLTASDAYNTGVLTSEAVAGAAPFVLAYATVSDSGSPVDGMVVRLINTERRFIRAGSSGALEDHALASHNHGIAVGAYSGTPGTYSTWVHGGFTSDNSFTYFYNAVQYAGGTETRPKNIGATYYMRIK